MYALHSGRRVGGYEAGRRRDRLYSRERRNEGGYTESKNAFKSA